MNSPKTSSPAEDPQVWKNIIQEISAGTFATTRADILAQGRVPTNEGVDALARMKLGVYLRFLDEVTDPRFVKRAKKAFAVARTQMRSESEMRKEVSNGGI